MKISFLILTIILFTNLTSAQDFSSTTELLSTSTPEISTTTETQISEIPTENIYCNYLQIEQKLLLLFANTSFAQETTTTETSTTTEPQITEPENIYCNYLQIEQKLFLECSHLKLEELESNKTLTPNKYFSQLNNATTTKNIYLGDTLIATIINNTPSYTLTDNLGSIEKTIDNSGNITSLSNYKPFGLEQQTIPNTNSPSPRKYIGELSDSLLGYSYLNARYYESNQGQFISQDPMFWSPESLLSNPQSMNSYSYGNNNPINMKDPQGLFAEYLYGAYSLSNYIQNSSNIPSDIRTMNYAVRSPVVGYQVGRVTDGYGGNISSVSSNFAVNAIAKSSAYSGIQSGEGTESNAFRHAVWQSILTNSFGSKEATSIGNSHEYNPYGNASVGSYKNLAGADQSADLLNNQIGRSIGINNPGLTSTGYAKKSLDYFYTKGLYMVNKKDGGGFQVVQSKISKDQYNSSLNIINGLGNNGLKK
jgi:RHS repeat-associated protein